MRVVSLASGSGGNAYCVEAQDAVLLVDCGICCRELVKRMTAAALDPERIVAAVQRTSTTDFRSNFKLGGEVAAVAPTPFQRDVVRRLQKRLGLLSETPTIKEPRNLVIFHLVLQIGNYSF